MCFGTNPLCLIYVLSHYILYSELLSFPIPFKEDPVQYSFVNVQKKNLFRGKGQIHKMFDKKEYDIPLDLMSTIDGTVNRKALVKEPKLWLNDDLVVLYVIPAAVQRLYESLCR